VPPMGQSGSYSDRFSLNLGLPSLRAWTPI